MRVYEITGTTQDKGFGKVENKRLMKNKDLKIMLSSEVTSEKYKKHE